MSFHDSALGQELGRRDCTLVKRERHSLRHLGAAPAESVPAPAQPLRDRPDARLAALAAAFSAPGVKLDPALVPSQFLRPKTSFHHLAQAPNTSDAALHDGYFAVIRQDEHVQDVLIEGVLAAAALLKAEARAPDAQAAVLAAIAAGLETAFELASGLAPDPIALAAVPKPAGRIETWHDVYGSSVRRWLRGHQIFLVLTQAMIQVARPLAESEAALDRGEVLRMVSALTRLMAASSAALQLTGSMSPEIYDSVIRPSMMPPEMPNGFSGMFSSDHRVLVQWLRLANPALRAAAQDLPGEHGAMICAFARMYDSHKAVCSRFVGEEQASLLQRKGPTCNALDQLEKFKRSRLRLAGG